jgi:hypothetical protein
LELGVVLDAVGAAKTDSTVIAHEWTSADVPTEIRPLIRIYYPAPRSNAQACILPPPNGSMGATYVLPALQQAG